MPVLNDRQLLARLFFAIFSSLLHVTLLHKENACMPFERDPLASSLIGRSALARLAYVAVGIAVLWAAIGWAVALA